MNIVIVEDEPKIRDGLQTMIRKNTQHAVTGAAENGKDGLKLIREQKPDLVITDIRMPVLSGLDMLAQVKAGGQNVCSIILSGYSDFHYAQDAIRIGVAEYLLKPVTWDDLKKSLKAVEQKMDDARPEQFSLEQLFLMLLDAKPAEKPRILKKIASAVQAEPRLQYTAILIKPDSPVAEVHTEVMGAVRRKMEMLCMDCYQILRLPQRYGILVLLTDTEHNKMLESDFERYILPAVCGICPCVCSCTRFGSIGSVEEQLDLLQKRFLYSLLWETPRLLSDGLIRSCRFQVPEYPAKTELNARQAICAGDLEKFRQNACEFKRGVLRASCEPGYIVEYFARFLFAVSATAQECDPEPENRLIYNELIREIGEVSSREELVSFFDRTVASVTAQDGSGPHPQNLIILKVIAFIRKNYSKEITLSQAADLAGVTPEYLSGLFNREMKINFSVFLKNYRISLAKRMLLSDRYQVQEIAHEVGFCDAKYFNRVFKEACGASPSDYKKSMK